jgi:hypothetical protein
MSESNFDVEGKSHSLPLYLGSRLFLTVVAIIGDLPQRMMGTAAMIASRQCRWLEGNETAVPMSN